MELPTKRHVAEGFSLNEYSLSVCHGRKVVDPGTMCSMWLVDTAALLHISGSGDGSATYAEWLWSHWITSVSKKRCEITETQQTAPYIAARYWCYHIEAIDAVSGRMCMTSG